MKNQTRASELTLRATLAGCVIGAALSAANVYTGLKTAYVDGGNITAAVLSFAFFAATSKGRSPNTYSPLENNITQTISSSAAVMCMVTGVTGPIPALLLAGKSYGSLALATWGISLGVLGVGIALLLRARLLESESLPFPTGTATAEVIEAMAQQGGTAARRARVLVLAAVIAGAVTWLRDGPTSYLPQELLLPFTIAGISASSLGLGISVSPLMIATGLLVELRGGISMIVGSVAAWAIIAPALARAGVVHAADHERLVNWLMWPGTALMLSSSLTSQLLQWRSTLRGLRDVGSFRSRGANEPPSGEKLPIIGLMGASTVGVGAIAWFVFGLKPGTVLLTIPLSVVLATVCARSAGETDQAPIGSMGGITQIVFGGSSQVASLVCGSVVAGDASQTAATLWALKAGQRLGANRRDQTIAQLIGLLVGGVVVVPTYSIIVGAYGLGTERMPAPGALSWKATADAVQGGLAALPPHAPTAALVALAVGCVLTVLEQTRAARFLPSPIGMGIAFLLPISLSVAIFFGACVAATLGWRRPEWARENLAALAGGAIAGESLTAVVMAALLSAGVLSLG